MSYHGRALHVDLSARKSWVEPVEPELITHYVGGRGLNAKAAWDQIGPDIDPLGPANLLIFAPGLLTGTNAPLTGRTTVTCLGPSTGLYVKSGVGGHIGAAIKYAGYDQIVIHGKADELCYLRIHNEDVRVVPAQHLRGFDARQTTTAIRAEAGGQDVKVACIGPAGENLVVFASIMVDIYSAAGRGGVGAVMGSKNLKALAVSGDTAVRVRYPEAFFDWGWKARKVLVEAPSPHALYQYGTAVGIDGVNAMMANTGLNYQIGAFDEGSALNGITLVERGYLKGREACYSCISACKRYTEVDHPRFGRIQSGGPEYESLAALGFGPGVLDTVAVLKGNELCNLLGLDTISAGSVISWLFECRQRGVDLGEFDDGLLLEWGNAETMLGLLTKIAHREGVGDLLAQGVRKAAGIVGQGSERWAVEAKGLEQSRVDTRSSKAYALAFAVNPRGPDHLHAQPLAEWGENELAVALVEKLTGDAGLAKPHTTEKRAEIVIWHEDVYAVVDSLGFCSFPTLSDYAVDPAIMTGLFNAATGASMGEVDLLQVGRRILTLEKCFNVRLGADRKLDRLPHRMMFEENASRPGEDNNPGELDGMLDRYYRLHGWDLKTSWPTRETLDQLGLTEVRRELEQLGRLPPSQGGGA